MDKEKNNALTEQFKKVKSGNGDVTTKKRKGSFLGGDVDIEDLPEMVFEKKKPEKKRTPEEEEASRLYHATPRPPKPSVYKEPSLIDNAMAMFKERWEDDQEGRKVRPTPGSPLDRMARQEGYGKTVWRKREKDEYDTKPSDDQSPEARARRIEALNRSWNKVFGPAR